MKTAYFFLLLTIVAFINICCHPQDIKIMQEQKNPLLCDPIVGSCEIPLSEEKPSDNSKVEVVKKPIRIIYYTDPICSSCWGIEPQLRKLKLEYGDNFEIEYRMGGLLPDWSYNSGGISKPADVAHHWDEVSSHYDMPIDGDVWLEDPLSSSYPPSIAVKAAQMQDNEKAILFLRELREMVFLQKKNITSWKHIEFAAQKVGLNLAKFKTGYEGKAKQLFEEDLKLGRELGVRGFPTMYFFDTLGREMIYGAQPYSAYQTILLKLLPTASKAAYDKSWNSIFTKYNSLTAKEFSELTETPRNECEKYLDDLVQKGNLEKLNTKNGAIWKLKK